MQVVTVETSAGQTRYYLANDDGTPVEPVLQYLRFRDNGGVARRIMVDINGELISINLPFRLSQSFNNSMI